MPRTHDENRFLPGIHPTWDSYSQQIPISVDGLPETLLGDQFKEKLIELVEKDVAVSQVKRICSDSQFDRETGDGWRLPPDLTTLFAGSIKSIEKVVHSLWDD